MGSLLAATSSRSQQVRPETVEVGTLAAVAATVASTHGPHGRRLLPCGPLAGAAPGPGSLLAVPGVPHPAPRGNNVSLLGWEYMHRAYVDNTIIYS